MLTSAVYLFRSHPEVARRGGPALAHVLVDAVQGHNAAQWELVLRWPRGHRNIMGWGRRPGHLPLTGSDFQTWCASRRPSPDPPPVIVLEQKYRSTQTILDDANDVIATNAGADESPVDRLRRQAR